MSLIDNMFRPPRLDNDNSFGVCGGKGDAKRLSELLAVFERDNNSRLQEDNKRVCSLYSVLVNVVIG